MALFDFLTGADATRDAAAKNLAAAQQGYGLTQGLIGTYQNTAVPAINQGYQTATGDINTGLGNYNQQFGNAVGAGQAGIAAFAPLSALGSKYGQLTDLYANELMGGPNARSAYQTSPGYQFQQDEAARAIANKASSLGIAGGGGTAQALSDRAQNIANTDYSSYLDRLAGFVNPELAATTGAAQGISGANRTLADLYQTGGATQLGAAGTLAGLATGQASDISNVGGNVLQAGLGGVSNLTSGTTAANNQQAQAAQQTANFWQGLLGGGLKLAGSIYGAPARAAGA